MVKKYGWKKSGSTWKSKTTKKKKSGGGK